MDLKMAEFKIHNLWPTPIYQNSFLIDDEVKNFIKNEVYERMSTDNGFITVNRYLLNNDKLTNLKSNIDEHLENYTRKFLDIKDNAQFYMQNSWANRHEPGDWAQAHYHTGSLISGVYYLDVPEKSGDLVFQRMSSYTNLFHSTINIEYNNQNYINEDLQSLNVQTGDIVLFPSHVMHKIRKNESNLPRFSIAFNYFVKGKFGKEEFQLELN